MRLLLLIVAMTGSLLSGALAQTLSDYVGDWAGELVITEAAKLPLVLHVEENDGSFSATLDSPAQGAFGIPAADVTLTNDAKLLVTITAIGARYEAALSENGTTLDGTFTQNGQEFSLVLIKDAPVPEREARPQEPGDDRPYNEEEVTFTSADGTTLAGTLVVPDGNGPFPGVVFLTGSGPQDRDETLDSANHKPFLVLSDHLARQGIASLRYDDRGTYASDGDFLNSQLSDFAADAAAALTFLGSAAPLSKAGFVGHSEGGVTAPLAVVENEAQADFIVNIAGPFTKVGDVVVAQIETIGRAAGADESALAASRAVQQQFVDIVLNSDSPEGGCPQIRLLSAGAPEAQRQQALQLCTPYFWSLLRTNAAPLYEQYDGPVLVLFGGKDVQVDADTHAPIARQILKDRSGSEVIVYDDKNHLFQTAKTGAMTEYGEIDETMAPEVMERISDWINAR
ncbi:MAG: alpha/beta hydrolase [Pseudomonadota bacterium]